MALWGGGDRGECEEEGRALRKRVKELKCSAVKALSEGGSSDNSLSQVAKECLIKCLKTKHEGATSLCA
ncbi:hypothetical protein SLA2020_514450 [Shorea laevis]